MYLNPVKIGRIILQALILIIIVYGVFIYILSPSTQQQIVGVLTSIFGLQILWFLAWVKRGK